MLTLLVVGFRLVNSVLSRSFFQPDEYWQALEVAHRIVWDYGYESWEWRAGLGSDLLGGGGGGIRSPLHPLFYVPLYWLLKVTRLDDTLLLTLAPRLLQGLVAAATDLAVRQLALNLLGPRYANAALFCSLSSFFNFHASTRTFSNSMETALTAFALALWPWEIAKTSEKKPSRTRGLPLSLSLAALASIMRPSSAVLWLFLGLHLYVSSPTSARSQILFTAAIVSLLAALGCFALDSAFYRTPTFTPLRFLHQNVFNLISLFYGANPFHFYVTQALPLMTLTQLPFVLHGLWSVFRRSNGVPTGKTGLRVLGKVAAATVAVYSLLGHKEWRFVHPLLPVLHLFAALSLVNLYGFRPHSSYFAVPQLPIRPLHLALLLASLAPALYLTAFHCRGQVEIMEYLRRRPTTELKSVGFLMPCHSTPWQSHLHRPGLDQQGRTGDGGFAWFIGCEPPVLGQDPSTYLDQSDFFYASPSKYLHDRLPFAVDPSFPPSPSLAARHIPHTSDLGWRHQWPSHLVIFDALLPDVGDLLREKGYQEEARLWNSHWHEDERRRGDVVVWRWVHDSKR